MTAVQSLARYRRNLFAALLLAGFCGSVFFGAGKIAFAETTKKEIAANMATLLRSARAVVSDNQALINDPYKGHKGFTGQVVLEAAKFNFRMETGLDIDNIDTSTLHGELLQAELEAVVEVVDEWQNVINEKGVGYKGFLPAIFAFQVTQRFREKKGEVAEIKLTAPAGYVRNKRNMPDSWEQDVIESRFRSPDHPLGRTVSAVGEKDGKKAFRLMLPEYYMLSCLGCHGQPKGATDKTGGKKEGGTLGALGGAISVIIYAR